MAKTPTPWRTNSSYRGGGIRMDNWPFAEGSSEVAAWIIAGGTTFVAILAAVMAALRDRRKTVVDEWIAVVNRHEKHIADLQDESDGCRSREIRLRQAVVYLHGVVCGQQEALTRANQKTDPIVPLSDLLPDDPGVDFRARTLRQNTALLHANAEKITESRTPAPPQVPLGGLG